MAVKEKIRSIYRDIKEIITRYADYNSYRTAFIPIYHLV